MTKVGGPHYEVSTASCLASDRAPSSVRLSAFFDDEHGEVHLRVVVFRRELIRASQAEDVPVTAPGTHTERSRPASGQEGGSTSNAETHKALVTLVSLRYPNGRVHETAVDRKLRAGEHFQ